MEMLPEDCVSVILSLTCPSDACKSSLVSSAFRSVAESDVVWERFLPSDYHDIVLRSTTPDLNHLPSKKELFLRLCNPILIDGGTKSFKLDKSSGKKSYILSARELSIAWSDNPECWSWKSTPESRFPEVAELRRIGLLEIEGRIRTRMLSPNTKYEAYLIIKINHGAYGLDSIPSETLLEMGKHFVLTNAAYLSSKDMYSRKQQMENVLYGNRRQMLKARVIGGDGRAAVERDEEGGWMEIELGEFFNAGEGEYDEEVKMRLREVKGYQLKGGLVVEGIEVRPK